MNKSVLAKNCYYNYKYIIPTYLYLLLSGLSIILKLFNLISFKKSHIYIRACVQRTHAHV